MGREKLLGQFSQRLFRLLSFEVCILLEKCVHLLGNVLYLYIMEDCVFFYIDGKNLKEET